jgi:hypothetical protein
VGPEDSKGHETKDVTWLRRMFFQQELPAEDMAMEPIEFAAPVLGAREGAGTDEESETEDATKDDDDGGESHTQ